MRHGIITGSSNSWDRILENGCHFGWLSIFGISCSPDKSREDRECWLIALNDGFDCGPKHHAHYSKIQSLRSKARSSLQKLQRGRLFLLPTTMKQVQLGPSATSVPLGPQIQRYLFRDITRTTWLDDGFRCLGDGLPRRSVTCWLIQNPDIDIHTVKPFLLY